MIADFAAARTFDAIVIQKTTSTNGVVYYASTLLGEAGVPHAFSTRLGGVSEGPFASLNLGNPGGAPQQDAAENISANYRLLHEAIGCENRRRVFAHQVHGACVLDPATSPATDSLHGGIEIGHGDAIVSTDPALLLSIRVADCVPILMADRSGKHVAAIHAGWRGVVEGAATAALERFPNPRNVLVAIGPAISIEQFEVGAEVLDRFNAVFGDQTPFIESPTGRPGKYHIDLREALRRQLVASGVPAAQIDVTDRCTVRDAAEFFSHRRENGLTGRMAALIGATP